MKQIPEDRDNMNGVQQLSLEATAVNQSLSQQLIAKVSRGAMGAPRGGVGAPMSTRGRGRGHGAALAHPSNPCLPRACRPHQGGDKHTLGAANPFAGEEGEELASAGYRYRKWELGPGGPDIVVRCEVNAAVTTPKGEVQLANIKVRRPLGWGRQGLLAKSGEARPHPSPF
jgi:hypothetical protein